MRSRQHFQRSSERTVFYTRDEMSSIKNTKYLKHSLAAVPFPSAPEGLGDPPAASLAPPPGLDAGGKKPPRAAAPQTGVADLQRKLISVAKEKGITIDLGKTGPNKDGVDGAYGGKTRKAVEDVAAKLGIKDPLDSKGRPTDAFKTALGLGTAPTTPGETEKAVEPAEVMRDVPVDGKNFSMGALIGSLPPSLAMKTKDNQEVRLSAAEALSRMVMIRDAVVAGGLPGGPEVPDVHMIRSKEGYLEAAKVLSQTRVALDNSLAKLDKAVKAEIARKRKEKGLPEAFSLGPKQEAYRAESAMSTLPGAIGQGLGVAYKWLYAYLRDMGGGDKTNPQSLLAVMKRNTDVAVDKNFPHTKWDEDQAEAVGKLLMEAGGWLGERIDPENTSQYFQGMHNDLAVNERWKESFSKNSTRIWPILRKQQQ